ncbi:MAG: hypothetical protein H5T83_10500 [Actinotalea sp.]|nr:hypothetical protein [Actinotalea sp.]
MGAGRADPWHPDRARYEFQVAEPMTGTAVAAFPGFTAVESSEGTLLRGVVAGRRDLHQIVERFELLGVTLLDVRRLRD